MRSYSRQEASTADEAYEALKIGSAAVEAGNLDKGLEVYQSILEIDPDNKIVRERIRKLGARPAIKPPKLSKIRLAPLCKVEELMTAADSGLFLAVLYDLNELTPQYPRDPILYFLKANVLRGLGRVKESVVNYEKSIGLNSRYSPAHLNLSCSYKEIGDLTAAKKSLERAIELDRKNFMAFYHLALLDQEAGDLDSAIENYLRALRIKPDHVQSNNNLGAVFLETGQIERAVKLLARAIETSPDFHEAYCNLGLAHKRLEEYDDAIECLEKALDLCPNQIAAAKALDELNENKAASS
mgnify:FL=1